MTGIKVALGAAGVIGGAASTITGTIVAQVPAIGHDTPVTMTVALVAGGIVTTATFAWKVATTWAKMETKVAQLEAEVSSLKKSRAAELREKLSHRE